jgi:2-isopropylmalate synthase
VKRVELYDTTLRDGTQRAGISLSVADKLKILQRLDRLGVAYVEGGWPGSNPKDAEFFNAAAKLSLTQTSLTAFGMTRRPGQSCDDDPNLAALADAGVSVVCVVGKTSSFQVIEVLRTTLDENIRMVAESVEWLRRRDLRVFFDAEHFFDGYVADSEYAMSVLEAASESGAEVVVLCDTNGGTLPDAVEQVIAEVAGRLGIPVGGHFHDDSGCGVANSLAAVRAGANQIQGCVNGYGERCGNADLLAIAANLELKMDIRALPANALEQLADVSRYVAEVCNLPPEDHRPYVGRWAFAHKGGLHVSAVMRNTTAYEHVEPDRVGNGRHVVASDLSGLATLKAHAERFRMSLSPEVLGGALNELKSLEARGFSFETADGSLEILLREADGWRQPYFEPLGFRAIVDNANGDVAAEATVRIVLAGSRKLASAEGRGPVDALNQALRIALRPAYPEIDSMHLTDYKVRVLDPDAATAASVRVLIETSGPNGAWTTMGVSDNVLEASWQALVDSLVVGFLRHEVVAAMPTAS